MVIWVIKIFQCSSPECSWSCLLLLGLYHFCPLLCPSLDETFLWYFLFSWRDLLVFPFLLSSSTSLHYSLKKAFLSLFVILWNSAFSWVYLSLSPFFYTSLLSSVICKAFSDNHCAFLYFFFFRMVLVTASCTVLKTSIHSSSGTLTDVFPWIFLPLSPYNC